MRRMYSENQIKKQVIKDVNDAAWDNQISVYDSNVYDRRGNHLFVEDDITMETLEGVTQTYGRWSLCGTHLMIVLAFQIANGTTISGNIANINLPAWVKAKIVPLYATYVSVNSFQSIGAGTDVNYTCALHKDNGDIKILASEKTAARDENLRVQFDLLIDTDRA